MRRPQTTIQILKAIEEVADLLLLELEESGRDELERKTDRVIVWAQRMIRWHESRNRYVETGEEVDKTDV